MGGFGFVFFLFIMYGIIVEGGSVQIVYIVIIVFQVVMMVYVMFLELSGDVKVFVVLYKEIVLMLGVGYDIIDDDVVW